MERDGDYRSNGRKKGNKYKKNGKSSKNVRLVVYIQRSQASEGKSTGECGGNKLKLCTGHMSEDCGKHQVGWRKDHEEV